MLSGGATECHARRRTHLTDFSCGSSAHVRYWHKADVDLCEQEPAASVAAANIGSPFLSVSPL